MTGEPQVNKCPQTTPIPAAFPDLKGSWLLYLAVTDDEDSLSNLLISADEVLAKVTWLYVIWTESLVALTPFLSFFFFFFFFVILGSHYYVTFSL